MKKLFIVVFVLGAAVCVWLGISNNKKEDDKLLSLGFTKEEASEIRDTFKDESIDEIITDDNKDVIKEMINNDSFDSKKIDDYLEYYKKNSNLDVNSVIKLVNHDIDKIDNLEYDDIILNLVDEKYFIYDNTERYVSYYKDNTDLSSNDIVTNVNSNLDRPYYTDMEKTDLSKGNLIIVNKYYQLDEDYVPDDLVTLDEEYTMWNGAQMTRDAYEAFKLMVDAAKEDGISISSFSPYRSYQTQYNTYWNYVSMDGIEEADTYSARPGNSEHQTGLAVDINGCDDNFGNTKEGKWLVDNSYKYGFILRYPKGKEYITGYQYEPWHFRYVGVDVATQIYELDITFEEYYAYYIN